MKPVFLGTLFVFCFHFSLAQDAQLLDNDWFIEKLEIEGVDVFL